MTDGAVTIAGIARFVSDLHLRPERPDLTERFSRFLADCAEQKIHALFILGDLFEYWIGDDNLSDPFVTHIVEELRRLSNAGVKLYFLHGNRDFLLGLAFATETGASLLPESIVLNTATRSIHDDGVSISSQRSGGVDPNLADVASSKGRFLLLHGDTLCTDDHAYQIFRRRVRTVEWQQEFLSQPLTARRAEAVALRQRSNEAVSHKSLEIMDVNPLAVREALIATNCHTLIHGHTHRPGCEVIDATTGTERWVLSDWEYKRGDALELKAQKLRRLDWSS